MKIALIICGTIYLITVIYNLIATHAVASAVARRIKERIPALAEKKVKISMSERIIKVLPLFIPLLHIGIALVFLLNYEYLIEETYDKTIIALANR